MRSKLHENRTFTMTQINEFIVTFQGKMHIL